MTSNEFDEAFSRYYEYGQSLSHMAADIELRNAYKKVYEDLKSNMTCIGLGGQSKEFMNGVSFVMLMIADGCGESEDFQIMWEKNRRRSKNLAQ